MGSEKYCLKTKKSMANIRQVFETSIFHDSFDIDVIPLLLGYSVFLAEIRFLVVLGSYSHRG